MLGRRQLAAPKDPDGAVSEDGGVAADARTGLVRLLAVRRRAAQHAPAHGHARARAGAGRWTRADLLALVPMLLVGGGLNGVGSGRAGVCERTSRVVGCVRRVELEDEPVAAPRVA
eukprot:1438682-Pleurochrysis_carterae.AAC.1